MHFKTLVTVTMPTVEEDPHENAAVEQSIDLLQARKDDLAKDIMAELTLCTLMGRTTHFARQLVGAVEEVMTPYSTAPPEEYKEFADMTEELKADYAKSVDCLKLPNGKIVECGSYPYFSKYSIVDGKVSQNKVGTLHHTRRTKQSRKIQYLPNCPRQKVYKTFEKYAEDYRRYEYNEEEKGYGFYCNPNAMWDWYQMGNLPIPVTTAQPLRRICAESSRNINAKAYSLLPPQSATISRILRESMGIPSSILLT